MNLADARGERQESNLNKVYWLLTLSSMASKIVEKREIKVGK